MRGAALILWLIFTSELVNTFSWGFSPHLSVFTWNDKRKFIFHRKQIKSVRKTMRSKAEKAMAQKKHQTYLVMTANRRRKKFINDRLMHSVRLL